jgi:protein phosphatase
VTTLRQAYAEKAPEEPIPEALHRALKAANAAIYQLAITSDGEGQVGTTLVAAVADADGIHWVAAGDSRLYGYRADTDQLSLLSQEHNFAAILQARVAAGTLAQADADGNPDRAALTSFLGLENIPAIDSGTEPVPLGAGDRLLLCSDGIHGTMSDQDLRQLIRQPAQQAAEAIIASVKAVGKPNQDNATIAIIAGETNRPEPASSQAAKAQTHLAAVGKRPSGPRWGTIIVAVGIGLLLVLVGIAIGLSLASAKRQGVPDPKGEEIAAPASGEPGSQSDSPERDREPADSANPADYADDEASDELNNTETALTGDNEGETSRTDVSDNLHQEN